MWNMEIQQWYSFQMQRKPPEISYIHYSGNVFAQKQLWLVQTPSICICGWEVTICFTVGYHHLSDWNGAVSYRSNKRQWLINIFCHVVIPTISHEILPLLRVHLYLSWEEDKKKKILVITHYKISDNSEHLWKNVLYFLLFTHLLRGKCSIFCHLILAENALKKQNPTKLREK